MSLLQETLIGKQIEAVMCDSEVTYLMLTDGTQITIRGLMVVQPVAPRFSTDERALLALE